MRLLFFFVLVELVWCVPSSAQTSADTIFVNGKIITVDARDSIAEAVAIRDGKILAIGPYAAVMGTKGPATRMIDLKGRTVTPGLIDTHIHLMGADRLYSIELSNVKSVPEVVNLVRERVAKAKPGEWIQGTGWDEGKLAEHRYIYAADLDKVSPKNPVWLRHTTGHFAVANSAALAIAKIGKETKSPAAGTIEKDGNGLPTGIIKEDTAMKLVTDKIPPYTRDQERDGLLALLSEAAKEGLTGVKNPGITEQDWSIYKELRSANKINAHLFALWMGGSTVASAQAAVKRVLAEPHPPSRVADDILINGGIKLYIDGSAVARTSWEYDEWAVNYKDKDAGNRGYPTTDPKVYEDQVRLIHGAGVHMGTHAIGDRAIDYVVDTYAKILKEKPVNGMRHSVIHANQPTDHAIQTMALLEKQYDAGTPETQPVFVYWIGDALSSSYGPARSKRLMPMNSYLKAGVKWASGSDFFVTPLAPRLGIWASVVHKSLKSTYGPDTFGTSEGVDVHKALRGYTVWAAHQMFLDDRIGTLESGKDADIAIWDRNMYEIPSGDLKDIHCEATIFQGRLIYRDEKSPIQFR
jgi:predicted amidohydrolase YtcJ